MIILKKIHNTFISSLEWAFVCIMYITFSFVSYYCLFVIGTFYHRLYNSIVIDLILSFFILWLLFNTVFNYVMVKMTSPGISQQKSKGFQKVTKHCKICQQPKPLRAKHCKICDKCILQMDHHCPLFHSCIGHHNKRYLINSITYAELTILLMLVLNQKICDSLKYEYLLSVQILLTTLCLVVGVYTILCWYLIIIGKTLIEFTRRQNVLMNTTVNENINLVFGTTSILRALLPSVRPLQHDGINWPQIKRSCSEDLSELTL